MSWIWPPLKHHQQTETWRWRLCSRMMTSLISAHSSPCWLNPKMHSLHKISSFERQDSDCWWMECVVHLTAHYTHWDSFALSLIGHCSVNISEICWCVPGWRPLICTNFIKRGRTETRLFLCVIVRKMLSVETLILCRERRWFRWFGLFMRPHTQLFSLGTHKELIHICAIGRTGRISQDPCWSSVWLTFYISM